MCAAAGATPAPSAVTVLIAYTAGMAAASIPIVPGGLGVVDGALILGLVAGGTTVADAIVTTILIRIISLGLVISVGWMLWLLIRCTERDRADVLHLPPAPTGAWARARRFARAGQGRTHLAHDQPQVSSPRRCARLPSAR